MTKEMICLNVSIIVFGLLIIRGFGCQLGSRAPCSNDRGNRIVGGVKTDIKRVPYQTGLLFEGTYLCGGSVVSNRYIITAAHCIIYFQPTYNDDQKLFVRVGSNYTDKGGIVLKVKKSICHPKFNLDDYDYDICILELYRTLKFNENIQPVKIANVEPEANETGIIAGWGTLSENGQSPKELHSVTVSVRNKTYCEKVYQKIGPITERMMCAGSEGKDSCQGDSGGGLVVNNTLVGISSTGYGCGLKHYPGVYTSVAHPAIRKFIKENIHF